MFLDMREASPMQSQWQVTRRLLAKPVAVVFQYL
jgi:hypothetical protein